MLLNQGNVLEALKSRKCFGRKRFFFDCERGIGTHILFMSYRSSREPRIDYMSTGCLEKYGWGRTDTSSHCYTLFQENIWIV